MVTGIIRHFAASVDCQSPLVIQFPFLRHLEACRNRCIMILHCINAPIVRSVHSRLDALVINGQFFQNIPVIGVHTIRHVGAFRNIHLKICAVLWVSEVAVFRNLAAKPIERCYSIAIGAVDCCIFQFLIPIRNGDFLPLRHSTGISYLRQVAAAIKCFVSNGRYAFRNGYAGQSAAIQKCRASNGRYSIFHHDILNCISAAIPRRSAPNVVRHTSGSRDRQCSLVIQHPRQIVSAGAIGNNGFICFREVN